MGKFSIPIIGDLCCCLLLNAFHNKALTPVSCYVQLRNPKEVTTEEYNDFYKKTFNEYLEPLASSHFTTEVMAIASSVQ